MKTVLFVILTAAITNNYVLVKFLGICPFLGVSKKLDQATGMSIAVIFVEVLATAVTWPIYHLLLAGKVDFTYMETVVFILVIAALVQLVEIVLKRYIPSLHKALGVYLPLITTNCGVLGVTMNNISDGLNYVDSLLTALGCGLGFFLAMVIFSGVRSRVEDAEPPKSFEGLPITLVSASIVSLSFFGFSGVLDRVQSVFYLLVLVGAFAATYSEIAAKIAKTPATLFLLPALIPLVPGGSAYYAMLGLVQNRFDDMRHYALLTGQWAVGLAAGICAVAVIRQIGQYMQRHGG